MRASIVTGIAFGLTVTPAALGNGRFPHAQQLLEDPADSRHLVVRSTYGVLTTKDLGESWQLICETAIGYGGSEDAAMGMATGGRLLAGVFQGLATSVDGGCGWEFAGGELAGLAVADLTVYAANRASALVMTGETQGAGVYVNQLYETDDGGDTWRALGGALDPSLSLSTLDVAPSDPRRIYISARETPERNVLLRSTDRGQTFTRLAINDTDHRDAYIAAIHPADPDVLYVRIEGGVVEAGSLLEDDSLALSTDGGETWTEVARNRAAMLGFALSPDASEVLIGFGDPGGEKLVDPEALGMWKSATGTFSFEKIYPGHIGCLAWTATGLYACTKERDQGFELGFAESAAFTLADSDVSLDGGIAPGGKSALRPLLVRAEIGGPLDCAPGTSVAAECAEPWREICAGLGLCTDGGAPDGGAADGAAGSTGSAGRGPGSGGGCACRVEDGGSVGSPARCWAWMPIAAVWARRRSARAQKALVRR